MSQELAPQFSKFERTHLKFWVQLGSFVLSPHRVCLALCAACFSITILTDPKHFQHLQFVLSSTLMAALAMVLRSCTCCLKPRQPNSHNGLPKTFKVEGATCNVLGPTWKIVCTPAAQKMFCSLVWLGNSFLHILWWAHVSRARSTRGRCGEHRQGGRRCTETSLQLDVRTAQNLSVGW